MKVIQIDQPGSIAIVERDIPTPGPEEVLIKIEYCGICGSDVATFTGNQPFASYPRIPGHEFAGVVAGKGRDCDSRFKIGDRVTGIPYFNCKTCYPCRNGKKNCCTSNRTMGVHIDGSFAEYIVLPQEHVVDGKGLDTRTLALIEPFSIGAHGVNRGRITEKDKVLVVGAGPIGMFAFVAAKARGAKVWVADVMPGRLEKALAMGADGIVNTSGADMEAYGLETTGGNGFDVCVEATGVPAALLSCIEGVCHGGRIVLIGNGKREITFNHSVLIKKEVDVLGSRNSLNDFEPLVELVANGQCATIEELITHTWEFENTIEAFRSMLRNDGSIMKAMIRF